MDHHQTQEQSQPVWMTRPHNGKTFLKSNLGVILMLATWVVSALIGIGIYYNKLSSYNDRIIAIEATQKRMDDVGTTFSHYGIESDKQRLLNLEIRMHDGEEQLKKLSVMDEKISRIDDSVKDIRATIHK